MCRGPRWRRGCTWSTTWTVRAAGAGPRAAAEDGQADRALGRGLSPAWALTEPRLPRAPRVAALPGCPVPGCEASRSCEGSRPRSLPPSLFLPLLPRRGVLGLLRNGDRGYDCSLRACRRGRAQRGFLGSPALLRPRGCGAALSGLSWGSCWLLLLDRTASGAFLGSVVPQRWWNEAGGNLCLQGDSYTAAAFTDILKTQPYFGDERAL